ncbi:DUF421 domain-containing protein [Pedobacter xixiisoli]|uniref:Uncharacterized membrane protein YcaP, DUF421 family n=1 Tax=Pedobacter xixiisoli TaxID=1476464 RepID=A0A285ZTI9_9SPHI|nr:YetF domain-containing protein [Pedobacter xixiisoli]SOD12948.1 Uncharacterized membrane protein YcaP, DUF421 family [Pedobacter xixiisoli]
MTDYLNSIEKILIGDEEWSFIPEIMFRTLLMYLVVLISLRVLGKRGVKQLSIFELVVIISLGSAAGDPMFYREVGILSAVAVFIVVVFSYKVTSYFVNKSKKVEILLEGSCTCVIEHGRFAIDNFKKETLAQDEFFAELRLKSVAHLGQVKLAILETTGSISVFFYSDEEVKNGLPILPALFADKKEEIKYRDYYSCAFCGLTELLEPTTKATCKCCGKDKWVKSINIQRVT